MLPEMTRLTPRLSKVIAVLVEYQNLPEADAQELADKFEGFGPTMFQNSTKHWKSFLGENTGAAVYCLIYCVRDEPGAMPKTITFDHYSGKPKEKR